jgi:hypothetical protein
MDLSGKWIDPAHRRRRLTTLILDLDSSVRQTSGQQEGTASNGSFACTRSSSRSRSRAGASRRCGGS